MDRASRPWAALAALNGLVAVAAGAFAAHGVRDLHARELLHTGAAYQLAHAVAGVACLALTPGVRGARTSACLFGVGALVFGGSLYLLAATGVGLLGAVTPIGGLLLLAGWAALLWNALRGGAA